MSDEDKDSYDAYAPALPPDFVESVPVTNGSTDEDFGANQIGPSIDSSTTPGERLRNVVDRIDQRSSAMKRKLADPEDSKPKVEREAWMMTPSAELQKKYGFGDGKSKSKSYAFESDLKKRDKSIDDAISKHNKKKRSKSLMEMHQKKQKKSEKKRKKEEKKKGEVKKTERRPFNRDTDLKVTNFSDSQKKSLFDKAKLYHSRFSHSNVGSKYL